jgi:hypothetical protein
MHAPVAPFILAVDRTLSVVAVLLLTGGKKRRNNRGRKKQMLKIKQDGNCELIYSKG